MILSQENIAARFWNCTVLFLAFFCLGGFCFALDSESSGMLLVQPPNNQIVQIKEGQLLPREILVTKKGSLVYFLNSTLEGLLGLEVFFDKKLGFCASGDMAMNKKGVFRSIRPFPPKNFVAVCFAQSGEYPFKVYGAGGKTEVLTGKITVKVADQEVKKG